MLVLQGPCRAQDPTLRKPNAMRWSWAYWSWHGALSLVAYRSACTKMASHGILAQAALEWYTINFKFYPQSFFQNAVLLLLHPHIQILNISTCLMPHKLGLLHLRSMAQSQEYTIVAYKSMSTLCVQLRQLCQSKCKSLTFALLTANLPCA